MDTRVDETAVWKTIGAETVVLTDTIVGGTGAYAATGNHIAMFVATVTDKTGVNSKHGSTDYLSDDVGSAAARCRRVSRGRAFRLDMMAVNRALLSAPSIAFGTS